MPTINQLPLATQINASDVLPISQAGATRSASIGNLLAATQPVITLASNTLLGRVSLGPGGPEPVAVGPGLALTFGSLLATGADHATFPAAPGLIVTDQAIISSAGQPLQLPLSQLRGLFTAGANVTIDPNGVIATTGAGGSPGPAGATGPIGPVGLTGAAGPAGSGTGIANAPLANSVATTDLVGVSQVGKDHAVSVANFFAGADVSKSTILPSSAAATTTVADYAARTVDPKDFGAKGDGTSDDYPAFAAAIASAKAAAVRLHVTRPTISYSLSQVVAGLNASIQIDDGVKFTGVSGASPFNVGRTEQRNSGILKTVAQGSQTGTAIGHETNVTNNGPHAAYGNIYTYQASLSATDAGMSDVAKGEFAHWHSGTGPGLIGHRYVACSPDLTEAPTAIYGMTAAEVNVVYGGPPTGWKPSSAGLAQWTAGFNFVPDAGYGYFGNGGHVLYGWGVNQNGNPNKAGIVPKTYNGFLVGSDAIAPGGRAVYLTGDTTNLPANFPHAPLEVGTGNWATGIRTDTATIASGYAVQIAATQALAWMSAAETIVAGIFSGMGAPAIAAPAGSLYARRDGGSGATLYVKETGAGQPGWMPYGAPGLARPATTTALGVVKIGANLTIASDGTLAASAPMAGPTGAQGATGPSGPAWSPPKRTVSGAADSPTVADDGGLVACTGASATTITVIDLGANRSFSVMQQGAGQVTVAAGAATTLVSDKAVASFVTARRGAILSVLCNGNGNAFVIGNTQ